MMPPRCMTGDASRRYTSGVPQSHRAGSDCRAAVPFVAGGENLENKLGTGQFGREIVSRVIYGAYIDSSIGSAAALVESTPGVDARLAAGYYHASLDVDVHQALNPFARS
jgi:ABC-type dipeptide/oligopeptide/nickel transport system permease subunit